MPNIQYEGQRYEAHAGESVLDCLLRNRLAIPHSCKSGSCQSCIMKCTAGKPSEASQRALKETLRAEGCFLACAHTPEADISVAAAGATQRIEARIAALTLLNETVMRVRLEPAAEFPYRPGQFINLIREDGLKRSYSLASLTSEGALELHVRRIAGGALSTWLHTGATPGTTITVEGPLGTCFYTGGNPAQPLILAGAGTGLAPLYGILRDALEQNHTGPIYLFHGARDSKGLYLTAELAALPQRYPNVQYVPSTWEADGPLEQAIFRHVPKLAGYRAYICGDPALVNSLRKKLFLAGMASKEIYADAFTPAPII